MKTTIPLTVLLTLFSASCASMGWTEAWKGNPVPPVEGDAAALMQHAQALLNDADTREEVEKLVATLDTVTRIEPDNREALRGAATYSILLGTGYSDDDDDDDKARHFLKAIEYAERSMYLNPKFKELADAGGTVWDSAHVLSAEDADAMGWWSTAVFYYYKEVLSYPAKISNYEWVGRAKSLMTRIDEVAPGWEGGGNYFSWAIYYIALPESAGGDLEKAKQYMDRSEAAGPNRLVTPWGRAKYLHVRTGDRAAFEKDLAWVIEQDPRAPGNPYPWNVYFQEQSKQLLAEADDIF